MNDAATTMPPPATTVSPTGSMPLTHWGLIRAQGADAVKFLHGQLTQDFALLGLQQARLAALCSPKGRMLASFVGFKLADDDVLLVCHRDLLAATLKRLSMFVLRAKCKLTDASEQFRLVGVVGLGADQLASACGLATDTWAKAPLGAQGGYVVRLPNASASARAPEAAAHTTAEAESPFSTPTTPRTYTTRLLACVPADADWVAPSPPLPTELWNWLEVMSGVALVSQSVAELFVPQMMNYESVGGVNFKKGCYPGQEVVARSQFRGTLKRRTYLVGSPEPLTPGQDVFHSSDAEQACGTVVAAATWLEQHRALVCVPIASSEEGTLTAHAPNGATLCLLSLPYALLADV